MEKKLLDLLILIWTPLGFLISAGNVYTYVDDAADTISWLGGNFVDDFAKGNPDAKWEARFNVNVGYYFLELNIILGVSNFHRN
jgi:hypothetical protein